MPIPTQFWIQFAVDITIPAAGIIVACFFVRRALWPALLLIIALAVRIAVAVGFVLATLHMERVYNEGSGDPKQAVAMFDTMRVVGNIFNPVSIALLVAAAVGWRGHRSSQPAWSYAQRAVPTGDAQANDMVEQHTAHRVAVAQIRKAPYFVGIYLPAVISILLSIVALLILYQGGSWAV